MHPNYLELCTISKENYVRNMGVISKENYVRNVVNISKENYVRNVGAISKENFVRKVGKNDSYIYTHEYRQYLQDERIQKKR